MTKPKVGQVLHMVAYGGGKPVTVTKVGRRYFYVNDHKAKFDLVTWSGYLYGHSCHLYESEKAYRDEQRRCNIEQHLYRVFVSNYGNTKFTLAQLEEAMKALNLEI